ncbi:MAG TPA: TRAP transporter substrate-binding protein DctP [Polyangiaceae bacterium]|jgi:TRAP-type C4-dicarboxylate transport system substrate-binding protein
MRLLIALGVGLACALVSASSSAATILKIGTLAPGDSPWGREFKKWAADVASETNGDVTIDVAWNGQAGDEKLMVEKIRSGQLDGAAVTAIGLGQTGVMDVLAFQLPGMFSTWQKLDRARDAVKDELAREFEAKGFTVLGWGDVGAAKTMSIGFEIRTPHDLQGKGVFTIPGDPISPAVFAGVGGLTPRSLAVPEILSHLGTDVNVLTVPPLVAEQLQWASRITHINTQTTAFAIGAFIMSSARLRGLTDPQRASFLAHGKDVNERLSRTIRNLDAQAFARMKTTKVAYDPTEAEKNQWRPVFEGVAKQLCGPVIRADFCKEVWDASR